MAAYHPYAHAGHFTPSEPSPLDGHYPQAHHFTPVHLGGAILTPASFSLNIWNRIDSGMRRMRFDRSFTVPRNYYEFSEHADAARRAKARVEVRKILDNAKEAAFVERLDSRFKLKFLNGNGDRILSDGRSAVLAQPSIWQPSYASCVDQSPWPPCTEFKHEGDERHTSQMDRFFPPPRQQRNETCNWQQGMLKRQAPMDETLPGPWAPRYWHLLNHQTNFPWWNTINEPLESDPAETLRSVWHHIERVERMLAETDDDY